MGKIKAKKDEIAALAEDADSTALYEALEALEIGAQDLKDLADEAERGKKLIERDNARRQAEIDDKQKLEDEKSKYDTQKGKFDNAKEALKQKQEAAAA